MNAQDYRFDFAETVVGEMIRENGGKVSEAKVSAGNNEETLKEVFG